MFTTALVSLKCVPRKFMCVVNHLFWLLVTVLLNLFVFRLMNGFFAQFGTTKLFFGSDFNSHHIAWGSLFTCRSGHSLWKVVADSDCSLLNDGSLTFLIHSYHIRSVLDLSIAHNSLALCLH